MNDLKFWRVASFLLVIALLVVPQHCKKIEKESVYITIPSKSNSFKYFEPVPIKGIGSIFIDNKDTLYFENPLNSKLEKEFKDALQTNDELRLKILYLSSIQTRHYNKSFNDDKLNIDVDVFTTGTLDSLNLKYTTFKDSVKLDIPKTIFRITAGPSLDVTPSKISPGILVGFENNKGNSIIIGGNINKELKVGYMWNLWDYKK